MEVLKLIWHQSKLCIISIVSFPCGSAGKESTCNAGDLSLIPGLGRSPEEGKGYPLQCSGLENSMDCIVHGVTKSLIWLSSILSFFSIVTSTGNCPRPIKPKLWWSMSLSIHSLINVVLRLLYVNEHVFSLLITYPRL